MSMVCDILDKWEDGKWRKKLSDLGFCFNPDREHVGRLRWQEEEVVKALSFV